MKRICPNLNCAAPESPVKDGFYRRKDDSKYIQRYRCMCCGLRFSSATLTETFGQKRRRINHSLMKLMATGHSMRGAARFLNVHLKTVERRMPFLAKKCRRKNEFFLQNFRGRIHNIQIDDLITKENSKLKPLSVTIAVDENRRIILATEVSQIPAFGHLSKIALKKYGLRKDEHFDGLTRLFQKITQIVNQEVLVKSDEHQRYPGFVSAYLPKARHEQFKSERGCIAGQGELKKVKFDPLFTVNHTCALLRANVNRLIRKTWCTTKCPHRLKDHIDIFTYYYNQVLLKKALSPL